MKYFKITPITWDSFSVRSTCTLVKVNNLSILIDPGIAIGPIRYSLPPSSEELKALNEGKKKIINLSKEVDIITISHYHYDHYFPDIDIYSGKSLFIKNFNENINKSQEKRGNEFKRFLESKNIRYNFSDDTEVKLNDVKLIFSPPLFHGSEKSKLGWVIALSVKYKNECFIHASDVQGPQTDETTEWIISQNPDVLALSGFPTLFLGWRFPKKNLEKSNKNLIKILKETKVNSVILDHHIVRDLNYLSKIKPVLEVAKNLNKKIITAADYLGVKNLFLEAHRKEFFKHNL